jgi:hypothetical protein
MTIATEVLRLLNQNPKTRFKRVIYISHGILTYCEVAGVQMALQEISSALLGVTVLQRDGDLAHFVFRRDKLTQKFALSRRA